MCWTDGRVALGWFVVATLMALLGWAWLGYAFVYASEWNTGAPMQWYHALPAVFGTLCLPATLGVRFYRADDDDDEDEDHVEGGVMRCHSHTVMMGCLVLLCVFFVAEWALAMLWAFKDWIAPGVDSTLGVALLFGQLPFTCALLARWRQLYVEYTLHRARTNAYSTPV